MSKEEKGNEQHLGRPLSYEEAQKVYSLRLTPDQYELICNNFGSLKAAVLHLINEVKTYAPE